MFIALKIKKGIEIKNEKRRLNRVCRAKRTNEKCQKLKAKGEQNENTYFKSSLNVYF